MTTTENADQIYCVKPKLKTTDRRQQEHTACGHEERPACHKGDSGPPRDQDVPYRQMKSVSDASLGGRTGDTLLYQPDTPTKDKVDAKAVIVFKLQTTNPTGTPIRFWTAA